MTDNPVLKIAKEKVRNLIERWLTLEEEQRLLDTSPPWLQEIILFALHTGMRRGEILDLQWSQVDLTRRTLTILEQKNGARDTLPLNATAVAVLQARAAGRASSAAYVFVNEAGHRRDGRNLLRSFYPAMRKAGSSGSAFMISGTPLPPASSKRASMSIRSRSWAGGKRSR